MAHVRSTRIPLTLASAQTKKPSYRQGSSERLWFAWEKAKARFSRARIILIAVACILAAIGVTVGTIVAGQAGSANHWSSIRSSL